MANLPPPLLMASECVEGAGSARARRCGGVPYAFALKPVGSTFEVEAVVVVVQPLRAVAFVVVLPPSVSRLDVDGAAVH